MPKKHLADARALAADAVLTRDALVGAGLNPYLGDRAVRAGQALRLAPSTYLMGTAPTDAQLIAAARAHAGDDLVVTGSLACRLLDLPDLPAGATADVLVPAGRRRVSSAFVRVQPTTRPPRCWRHSCGVWVADPHRAVVDAARRMTQLQDVRALVLAALRLRWCGVDGLREELEAGARSGSALCRRALRDAEAGAWSAPEAEVADMARQDRRLPPFLLNPTLLIDGVVVGKPDGWFLGRGLGWEVDSRRFHASDDRFDATLARHDRFGAHGLQLLHVTPRRARLLGAGYGDVLAAAVAARAGAAQPEPPGLVVRPYDARARTVRDLCSPPPVIDRSSGALKWAFPR